MQPNTDNGPWFKTPRQIQNHHPKKGKKEFMWPHVYKQPDTPSKEVAISLPPFIAPGPPHIQVVV